MGRFGIDLVVGGGGGGGVAVTGRQEKQKA